MLDIHKLGRTCSVLRLQNIFATSLVDHCEKLHIPIQAEVFRVLLESFSFSVFLVNGILVNLLTYLNLLTINHSAIVHIQIHINVSIINFCIGLKIVHCSLGTYSMLFKLCFSHCTTASLMNKILSFVTLCK